MLSSEYALIRLFNSVPQIIGRKKLQKVVYLLQQIGVPYTEKFSYHHYGPYSAELQAEIDRLVDYRLLTETFTDKTYIYKITEEGNSFLKKYEKNFGGSFDLPQDILERLMDTHTYVLEMASTYAYLLEMGYQQDEALEKALELKPHLSDCIDDAKALYDEIIAMSQRGSYLPPR